MLRPTFVIFYLLTFAPTLSWAQTGESLGEKTVPWDLNLLQKVPQVYAAPEVKEDGVRSLYFEGAPYHGKPTKVFAFYGAPAGAAPGQKFPAIVLVHGGGGTAFARWVRQWNQRGYAAIAFDHFGGIPIKANPPPGPGGQGWESHPDAGPSIGECDQLNLPVTDQWMYHGVADAMLAASLLASFPEVDAKKLGIEGVSWGSVIACSAVGIDHRFSFAIMVYGCGFISDDSLDGSRMINNNLPYDRVRPWRDLWDPANYLPGATLPILWVDGSSDFAFTLSALQKSYHLPKGPRTLCTRVNMVHGQEAAEVPLEIPAFADSIVKSGAPLVRIIHQGIDGHKMWAEWDSTLPVVSGELNYTLDNDVWQKRKWQTVAAQLDVAAHRVSADIPDKTTACYLNLIDGRQLIVSTEHVTFGER